MTTFQNRELVRDELVALFVANTSWQEVYGYFPGVSAFVGKTPVLVVTSVGTQQDMANLNTNPATYRFLISSYVLAYRVSDSWYSTDAADKIDELDMKVRQIIRDNAGGGTNADQYRFESGFSQSDNIIASGVGYIVETRAILADLVNGAV